MEGQPRRSGYDNAWTRPQDKGVFLWIGEGHDADTIHVAPWNVQSGPAEGTECYPCWADMERHMVSASEEVGEKSQEEERTQQQSVDDLAPVGLRGQVRADHRRGDEKYHAYKSGDFRWLATAECYPNPGSFRCFG